MKLLIEWKLSRLANGWFLNFTWSCGCKNTIHWLWVYTWQTTKLYGVLPVVKSLARRSIPISSLRRKCRFTFVFRVLFGFFYQWNIEYMDQSGSSTITDDWFACMIFPLWSWNISYDFPIIIFGSNSRRQHSTLLPFVSAADLSSTKILQRGSILILINLVLLSCTEKVNPHCSSQQQCLHRRLILLLLSLYYLLQ